MTLKHAQAELKTKQAEVKKMDSGYKKDQDNLQAVRSSREKLEAELAKLNYEGVSGCPSRAVYTQTPFLLNFCNSYSSTSSLSAVDGKEEGLLEKRRQLYREVAKLKETYERLVSRFPNLRFDYR